METAEIDYAGPAEGDVPERRTLPPLTPVDEAPPSAVEPAPAPGTAVVLLGANRPDASFYAGMGVSPRLLCTGACGARVLASGFQLGMSLRGRPPVPASVRLDLRDGDVVEGVYRRRRGGRTTALVFGSVFATIGLVGVVGIGASMGSCTHAAGPLGGSRGPCNMAISTSGGFFVLGVGLLIGSAAIDDQVTARVRGRPEAASRP